MTDLRKLCKCLQLPNYCCISSFPDKLQILGCKLLDGTYRCTCTYNTRVFLPPEEEPKKYNCVSSSDFDTYHKYVYMSTKLPSGSRCQNIFLSLRLGPFLECATSEGSGETAWMRRLVRAFAARGICDISTKVL